MNPLAQFVNFLESFILESSKLITWLLTPLNFDKFNFVIIPGVDFTPILNITPLMLLSIDGLIVFVVLAMAKWILS